MQLPGTLTVSGCPNSSASDCAPSRLAVLLLPALPGALPPPVPPPRCWRRLEMILRSGDADVASLHAQRCRMVAVASWSQGQV